MHGRTDDGRKVITIAHPEHSSGELKMIIITNLLLVDHLISMPVTLPYLSLVFIHLNSLQ